MNWNYIKDTETLNSIKAESDSSAILIFKHSTRCSISSMALSRLERSWDEAHMSGLKPYYLDLISYRNISNQISDEFGVEHQSPQVIVIKSGKAIYDNSHMGINYEELKAFTQN